jgi:hypothetical protein
MDFIGILNELKTIIDDNSLEKTEKHKNVIKAIVTFYIKYFNTEEDEVAIFFPNELKTTLRFIYPFYLSGADEIPINSSKPIVSRIFRSGLSFLDNDLVDKERLFQYEFIKNYNDEARIIWKLIGAVIKFKEEKIGVVQVSRKRSSFQKLGENFTSKDLHYLERSIQEFAPYLKIVFA